MRGLLPVLRGLLAATILVFSLAATQAFLKPEFSRTYGAARFEFRYDAPLAAPCFRVLWQTENATEVLLDMLPVDTTGSQFFCPSSANDPRFAVTFADEGMKFYSGTVLWNTVGTYLVFLLAIVTVFAATFYTSRFPAAGLVLVSITSISGWTVIGMPLLPVLTVLETFVNIGLLPQIFLVALVVPVLYWLMPVRWRGNLLLVVSGITLLRGGVSVEYLALLAILISLTWIVVVPPATDHVKSISALQFRTGLGGIVALAITLALFQRLPVMAISGVLVVSAVVGAVAVIIMLVMQDRASWRQYVPWLVPVAIIAAANLVFFPYLDVTGAYPWALLLLPGVVTLMAFTLCLTWASHVTEVQQRQIARAGTLLLILIFILFKLPADGTILPWFGFSYIAFRLLHVLLDKRLKIELPAASLKDWSLYTLFFSAQAVGPIDRWNRFAVDVQSPEKFSWESFVAGWARILWGAIKKFFIADILLRDFIPGGIPVEMTQPLYAWLQLYAYALYLYCDFSGFVDIAIGTARLVGFHLPENFDRPYTRGSLAQFWQSWHITLSGWLRAYVFLPLTRALLRTSLKRQVLLIVLITNLATMSLIGLWHGFTANYLAWGIWHALGLFIHKVFSDYTRRTQMNWKNTWRAQAFHIFSVLLTFHFVVAGWVFFALPTFEQSIRYLALLAGVRL